MGFYNKKKDVNNFRKDDKWTIEFMVEKRERIIELIIIK